MQTYLKNGYIVSMDQQDTVFDGGGVLVEDDRITAVGKVDPRLVKPDAEVIDLQGRYVLPGFVNTHVHTSQQISRGVGDDVDFICWLHDRMWPFESSMTEEDSYVSGEGLPEIWQRTMEQELEQQVADLEKFHNTADGRVQVWFGLRTIFNNTDELCVRTKELADKYGVGIHMHVAEAKEEKEYTYTRWGFRHARAGLCTDPEDAGDGAAALHRYGRRVLLQPHGHGGRDVADQPDPQGLASGHHGGSLAGYSADGHQVGRPRTAGRGPVRQSGMRQEGGPDRH